MVVLISRTLITGMVSGSIVAFNIDFNRWHYEHQNRYWVEINPCGRKQVGRIKGKHQQTRGRAVLRKIQRAWKRSSVLQNISMVMLINNKVWLRVFILPPWQTCCWTIWTHFLLVFMSYQSSSWYISPAELSESVVVGNERLRSS